MVSLGLESFAVDATWDAIASFNDISELPDLTDPPPSPIKATDAEGSGHLS